MRRLASGLVLAVMATMFTACGPPPPARFTVWDLGTLGGDRSIATDVNNAGQIVGWSTNASNRPRAFSSDGLVMTDQGTLGGSESTAAAVNDAGEVVGAARIPGDTSNHAFMSPPGGPMTDLGTLGGQNDAAVATDINASSEVVGGSWNRAGYSHAFLRGPSTNDVMTDLGSLSPAGYSLAQGINNNGDIVGVSEDRSGRSHAFLTSGIFTGGLMVDLGTLGGTYSRAVDVNLSGFVVGSANLASGQRHAMGIVYGGAMVDLGTLGGPDSDAGAVNNENDIVGTSTTSAGTSHAFLHEGFTMVDLNTLIPSGSGWELVDASGINDHGQIVGWGRHNGLTRAFLLTPAPEASIGDVSLAEGNSGTKLASFEITLAHTTSATVTVNYATANGTAVAPGDYTAATGTVTFFPFQKTKTVTVTIKGDTLVEPAERFVVNLSTPSGLTIGDGQGQGTLTNDD